VLAAITLSIALFLIVSSRGPITRTAYNRIKEGMSEDEVLGILVLPPGNYSTDFYTAVSEEEEGKRKSSKRLGWIGDEAMIDVEFDDRGKVCWKAFHEIQTRGSFPQQLKSLWWSVRRMF
jgi:hypothetical protein